MNPNAGPIARQKATRAGRRRPEVLELRIQGFSFRAIGRKLGISHVQAWEDYRQAMEALDQIEHERAEQLRDLELRRLDWLFTKLLPQVEAGETKAITAALKISERRCALLGLDAPKPAEQPVEPAALLASLGRDSTDTTEGTEPPEREYDA